MMLDKLLHAGLLIPTGVDGLYGRSGTFESVITGFDRLITVEAAGDAAESVFFPPVLPRRTLETTGYLASFPHLAGTVFGFAGDEEEAASLAEAAAAHTDWSGHQTITEIALTPAACYPVYPWIAGRGRLPVGGTTVDIVGYCFRNEPSDDPARLQAFRQHEHVRIGDPDEVVAWHGAWVERGTRLLRSVGLEVEVANASDAFFGRSGRLLAANQREQGLKLELVYPIADTVPTAVMSVNHHLDHFGLDFGIALHDGGVAHSACFGFGLERVALALLARHGLDVMSWPEDVRSRLRLGGAT